MKKNLWYLMALVCCLGFFVACSDDDDPKPPADPVWSDYVGTYAEDNLTFTGSSLVDKDVTVTLAKGTEDGKARITIKNALWEAVEFSIDNITVSESGGNYTFTASTQVTESKIDITGTLRPLTDNDATTLTIAMTREIVSDLVGTWNLAFNGDTAAFNLSATNLPPQYAPMIEGMIGGVIGAKVEDVEIEFTKDGKFNFEWKSVETGEYISLTDVLTEKGLGSIAPYLQFEYFVDEDVVKVGMGGVETLLQVIGNIELPGAIGEYLSLVQYLDTENGFTYLPVKFEKDEDIRFYLDQEKILPIWKGVSEMLGEQLAGLAQYPIPGTGLTVGVLIQAITGSDEISVGLTFE